MHIARLPAQLALAGACAIGASAPASAHPHMWIDMHSYVVFNDRGLITGIDLEWTFDDGYAQMALDGLDTDGDGVYSQDELAPLTKENIESLKDYNYFTVPRVNGEVVPIDEVTEYGQIYSNGKLALHFQVPLKAPVDPRKDEFLYKVYDPEFFIDMEYADKDSVGTVGTAPKGCKLKLIEVSADQQTVQIKQMLSTKGKEWKPPANEDFGGMFAQPTLVVCTS
jgi:ABC-type uncharacterized transport system substrate-binding protein